MIPKILLYFLGGLLILNVTACNNEKKTAPSYSSTIAVVKVVDKKQFDGKYIITIEEKADAKNAVTKLINVTTAEQWNKIETNHNYTIHYILDDSYTLISIYPEGYSGVID